ncbi:hypothetical protein BRD13_08065 [Halobacteriales archaeon SW_5_70_135]|nr:MAG: hypothetical protein BRD13_08065 [Halobacteriales archaeon SW_5_70_135]
MRRPSRPTRAGQSSAINACEDTADDIVPPQNEPIGFDVTSTDARDEVLATFNDPNDLTDTTDSTSDTADSTTSITDSTSNTAETTALDANVADRSGPASAATTTGTAGALGVVSTAAGDPSGSRVTAAGPRP